MNQIFRLRYIFIATLLLLLGLFAAAPSPALAQHEDHSSHDGEHQASDSHQGHNEKFLDPELDVDRYADRFESESREVFALREEITATLDLREGMVVADIGAGTGAYLDPFVAAVGANGHYFGVEISPRFAEHIRDRATEQGYRNVTAVLSAFESATLPAHSIDLAFICDTYHHFDDYEAMLASIRYALKPGGQMVVVDFDKVPNQSRDWILEHVRATKEQFTQEIEAAGFEFVDEIEVEGLQENFILRFSRP